MKYKMKMGERGQVVIPKVLRERYSLYPDSEVEFVDERGHLVIQGATPEAVDAQDPWEAVRGMLKDVVEDVDADIEDMRGR